MKFKLRIIEGMRMSKLRWILVGVATVIGLLGVSGSTPKAQVPVLQPAQITYSGAFRLSQGVSGGSSFSYAKRGLAYLGGPKPSLYITGHDWYQKIAQVEVPMGPYPTGATVSNLPTAKPLQGFVDPTVGRMNLINPTDPNSKKVGGILALGPNYLLVSAYSYYDGNGTQKGSHFILPSNLASATTSNSWGPFIVGNWLGWKAGYVSGYMGYIPRDYKAMFGGKGYLTGNCCLAVIGRTSYGPALAAFNVEDFSKSPVPATPLLYYPEQHPLGTYVGTSPYFNGATSISGVVYPNGYDTILFIGKHGLGTSKYGIGTADISLDGTKDTAGNLIIYDPADQGKGPHAYPYRMDVWMYRASDLSRVSNGTLNPWDPQPYAVVGLPLPFSTFNPEVLGAAYDGNRTIYVTVGMLDGDMPLVLTYSLP